MQSAHTMLGHTIFCSLEAPMLFRPGLRLGISTWRQQVRAELSAQLAITHKTFCAGTTTIGLSESSLAAQEKHADMLRQVCLTAELCSIRKTAA